MSGIKQGFQEEVLSLQTYREARLAIKTDAPRKAIMTAIYSIPHVTLISIEDDLLLLRIEDTELFDTFDDILIEQFGITDYTHSSEVVNDLPVYTIYFPKGIDKNKVLVAVQSIDKAEVERIFKINND